MGRVIRPTIASPQIMSRSKKLAARKNQAFNSVVMIWLYWMTSLQWAKEAIERGLIDAFPEWPQFVRRSSGNASSLRM